MAGKRSAGGGGLTARQRAFIAAYRVSGNVSLAAAAAKISRCNHYDWLTGAEYAAAFADAQEDALDLLEAEARRRALDGIEEPIVYQGEITRRRDSLGRRTRYPQTVRRYSDVLLIFLLKGGRPEKYRDNWKGELELPKAPRGLDLARLTDEQLEQLRDLTRLATGAD